MKQLIASAILPIVFLSLAKPDDKPSATSTRAVRLRAIRDDYKKANEEMIKALEADTLKSDASGRYPEWDKLTKRTLKASRELIDADPRDAAALDALIFCLNELGGWKTDPDMYDLVVKYHATSDKIEPLLRLHATEAFLRATVAGTPHTRLRDWANYYLADKLYANGNRQEAEALAEAVSRDKTAKETQLYQSRSLADEAASLLFEIRRLNVGQEVPEIVGKDLDGKPMKLSESRGKVTAIVVWATWCEGCMANVPNDQSLLDSFAARPFVIVGLNCDLSTDGHSKTRGADGKLIDNTDIVRAKIQKSGIKWRSFCDGDFTVAKQWNIRCWPSVYLIDHHGIIRGKWQGQPPELYAAVKKLVQTAESENASKRP